MDEIFVVPFFGQGHLFPSMELCKHLSSQNYQTTLIIPSHLSSSVPSSLRHHPSVLISEIPSTSPPPPPEIPAEQYGPYPFYNQQQQLGEGIESLLQLRSESHDPTRLVCAVVDVMMSCCKDIFAKFRVPVVSFFTSGACSSAMDYAAWKIHADEMKPGEIRNLPGLPEDMALAYSDLERRPRRGPPGCRGFTISRPVCNGSSSEPGQIRPGPPGPGQRPRWLDEVEGSVALLINTCSDLERPFIDYIGAHIKKPVWGVGPLLPEQYWKAAGSLIHDDEIRSGGRESNYTENQVTEWLNLKARRSVIYISFGSEVGPTVEEYGELANALERSNRAFIWVIQPGSGKPRSLFGGQLTSDSDSKGGGYYPDGVESKVGDRGLIICGWAPQLLILSHQSTGAFLSHCGWNSIMEAIGRGVPMLTWPIRGDQYYNAKLIVAYLRVGYKISKSDDPTKSVEAEDILQGIQNLMGDEDICKRTPELRNKFEFGFPATSLAALDAFTNFIKHYVC